MGAQIGEYTLLKGLVMLNSVGRKLSYIPYDGIKVFDAHLYSEAEYPESGYLLIERGQGTGGNHTERWYETKEAAEIAVERRAESDGTFDIVREIRPVS